jgi:hypothetical protein
LWTPEELVEAVSTIPRDGAFAVLCTALSTLDIDSSAEATIEAQWLAPLVRQRIHGFRANNQRPPTVFHTRQLLHVLALLAKYADETIAGDRLSESEAFRLGEVCLQINALADNDHYEESYDDCRHRPIASRAKTAQDLALNGWFSARPANGFMSVLRAYRILLHHFPAADYLVSANGKPTLEIFEDMYGVSCEKAFSLLATLCQVRYPPSLEKARPCHLEISSLWGSDHWTADELRGIKRLFVRDIEGLRTALPENVIADPLETFRVLAKTPIIELPGGSWWSYGPILSELLLRSFLGSLRACAPDTKVRGRIDNAFGKAVELYVQELFDLAKNAAPVAMASSLSIAPAQQSTSWIERKPEFEIGIGTVRQLIEIKSNYFQPAELFGRGWYRSIENHLFSEVKGLGQLACCAVARYCGLLPPMPARIQSILVVLEALPTLMPGIQHEARSIFKEHLKSYESSLPSSQRRCEPALLPVFVLSLEELEAMLALATVGLELKDILDKVFGRQGDVALLPARTVLHDVWHSCPKPPTYDWLGSAYDGLYVMYDRVFGSNAA